MSSKKRFDNIEPPQPPKKSSLLGKFSFRRKLELPGVEREEEITLKIEKKPEPRPAPAKQISPETRVELKNLAEEIEQAEIRAQNSANQQRVASAVKKAEVDKELELQAARASADSAKSRLLVWLVLIMAAIFIFWAASRPNRSGGRHGNWADAIYFIIAVLGAAFGGGRYRRRNRW